MTIRSFVASALCSAAVMIGVSSADVRNGPPANSFDPNHIDQGLHILSPAAVPFLETFETGAPGWTLTGKWHARLNPQTTRVSDYIRNYPLVCLPDAGFWPSAYQGVGTLVYSDDIPGTPEEGTFVAPWNPAAQAVNNGGESLVSNTGDAVTPAIDLTELTAAQLRIRTWYEIESVDPAPDQFDGMLIAVSADGGPFSDIGYSGPAVDYNGLPCEPASSGGFNLPGVWVEQVFDLTPFAGNVVNIRFRFQTRDQLYNAFRGWFLDNVSVEGAGSDSCTVTGVSPTCSAPGFGIQVLGTNFVSGSVVYVGPALATPSSVMSTGVIECTVPPLPPGTYDVRVVRPDGTECELSSALTIDPVNCPSACAISTLLPPCAAPGNIIQVFGLHFQPGSVLYLGATPCLTTFVSQTELRFTVPEIENDTYPVKVVSPTGDQCTSPTTFTVDRLSCPTSSQRRSWGELKTRYR